MPSFLQRRLIQPIKSLLLQGVTPERLALSLASGIILGTFPMLGTTTALCALAAIAFRLNLPAIQLVNYLMYPVQLLLVIPFLRMGAWLFRVPPTQLSVAQMMAMARADLGHAIRELWVIAVHAAVAWSLIAPFALFALYHLLAFLLRRTAALLPRGPHPIAEKAQ